MTPIVYNSDLDHEVITQSSGVKKRIFFREFFFFEENGTVKAGRLDHWDSLVLIVETISESRHMSRIFLYIH